ncbi:MAG: UPF0158 family protein [Planctomycetota bacterium]
MPIPVRLSDVIQHMEMAGPELFSLLNRRTGEFVFFTAEEQRLVEEGGEAEWADAPDWQRETLPKVKEALESDDWVGPPDEFDIHEWSIMERFTRSVGDDEQYEALSHAIHGSGAFRRFKDTIYRLGIEDEWYRYRDATFERIAIDWLEAEGIPYVRDTEE